MKQPLGIAMILLGAVLFHVASHGDNPGSITDIWKSILNSISGVTTTNNGSSGALPTGGTIST